MYASKFSAIMFYAFLGQGEFEGVLPEDLRRRTETQTKFGAQFWRRIISNKIWRMILAQHLTT